MLNSGVVIHGSLVISLAGVDLVYVGLNVILTSVETALRNLDGRSRGVPGPRDPMACLLYCVTQPDPAVNVTTGVCDAAVQSREMLGVRVYWSNIDDPGSCLGEAEALKEAALQFHQVLREVLAVTTPIPFRFPTLLESDEASGEASLPPSRSSIAKR